MRTSFFPFTEPSVEFDVTCFLCGGEGCHVCGHSGWIEMGGAGVVDPAVFEAVGHDPEVWSGFAFGFGIERIAMLRHGFPDLRLLWNNDLRFLRQFDEGPRQLAARVRPVRPARWRSLRSGCSSRAARSTGSSTRGVPDTDGNLGSFLVGRVLEAGKHPNADRLQVCLVDVGEAEPRQIVCGAWNFGAGATVAVALPGAVLPDGRTLGRGQAARRVRRAG